jgi:hypothetical protein
VVEFPGRWVYEERLLGGDPSIALPVELIGILERRLPKGLLTADEYRFERAFSRAATGWYSGKPFSAPMVHARANRAQLIKTVERQRRPRPRRLDPGQIMWHMADDPKAPQKEIEQRHREDPWFPSYVSIEEYDLALRRGYCGWLLTNAKFNDERRFLPDPVSTLKHEAGVKEFCGK